LLAKWRNPKRKVARPAPPAPRAPSIDPVTGRLISPIVAAALCVKPRGTLTSAQAAKVDALKSEWRISPPCDGLPCGFAAFCEAKTAASLLSG
jgi:hypothetical protein